MTVSFEEGAWEEYLYWQKTDRKILQKINEWIKSIQREPFTGVGKTETCVLSERLLVSKNQLRTSPGLSSGCGEWANCDHPVSVTLWMRN